VTAAYAEFLQAKAQLATATGLEIDPAEVHLVLKPHQRDAVVWAVRGGRRAIFASFGLGKTLIQLEILRLTLAKLGGGKGLIVLPLGVRQEFTRDAGLLGLTTTFIRSAEEASADGIYLTNYESARDGKLDPKAFAVVSLDEAAVLRSYGSKTYQAFLPLFDGVSYRFVATATPSPNRYKELIHYAAFLGVMDTGQALTRFFQRDSTKANNLTLYPHKEREFWLWLASWALFVTTPSDLDPAYSDEGYVLPDLEVRWHEIPVDHASAPADPDGQGRMFRGGPLGVTGAAREKRDTLAARVAKAAELVAEAPGEHFILWHDLEDERRALKAAIPEAVEVYGSLDLEVREQRVIDFSDGKIRLLATKPELSGAGCNFQRHCHRAIFIGVGFVFHDFVQAVHRIHRFLQPKPVRIDVIYAESEREVVTTLQAKWSRHQELTTRMRELIREHGLSRTAIASQMRRSIGVERQEASGPGWKVVNNDCVPETQAMAEASVDLIVTSIPFANHYEYSPSYNDFGHTDDNDHFWAQMDYLTPELCRVLKPGRIWACHVKDRILFGNVTGAGVPTVSPFHAEAIFHGRRHGFDYLGMITVVTDVVRENNQTYRLGFSEQCKDGTKMGVGSPEYIVLFHKPQSDRTRGYADAPVVKDKADYSLARWQVDAHAFWRSDGNRPLRLDELASLPVDQAARLFTDSSLRRVYDYEAHVRLGEQLAARGSLPTTFMALAPGSHHPQVWHDVNRMRTLNGEQSRRAVQQHVCPLQFDIVDRLITRYSNPGETVYDPFAGLMTVPYCAVRLGRHGIGVELNPTYWRDGVAYVEGAARKAQVPTLFDLLEEGAADAAR
jgi:hypothetical protein